MSEQVKRSLIRAGWTFLFTGVSALVVFLASIPPEKILEVGWRVVLSSFLAGGFMGLKKYVDWTEFEDKPL